MSANQKWAYAILALSIVALGIGIAFCFWRYHWKSRKNAGRVYFFMGFLLLSVFLLQIAYTVGSMKPNCGTAAQRTAEIFSGTFRFFSLDADYAEMIKKGACAFVGWGVYIYYILFCIYTVIVPIAGGCFIIQFFSSLIPRFRLFINWKKTKFVFSELNNRSILLAEDIARLSWELKKGKVTCESEGIDASYKRWLKSACIIFTDVYTDEKSEVSSELLTRARRIGAICLKDDILERSVYSIYLWKFAWGQGEWSRRRKKIIYFLMDEKEEDNTAAAVSLLSEKRELWKRTIAKTKTNKKGKARRRKTDNMEMYVFTRNSDAPAIIENAFLHNCEQSEEGTVAACDRDIIVKVINEYRSLVYGEIFDDHPLYNYLCSNSNETRGEESPSVKTHFGYRWLNYYRDPENKSKDRTLQVAILGGGKIGKEFYKTISWCGQMLSSMRREETDGKKWKIYPTFDLRISVLAENAKQFENALRLEMPELFKHENAGERFKVTTFDMGMSDPHDSVGNFVHEFSESGAINAGVIMIAFGNDDINLNAARWVERKIKTERKTGAPATIFYVIENDELYQILKKEDEKRNEKESLTGCILKVCGSLKSQRMRLRNVFLSRLERRGLQAERMHDGGCKDGKRFLSGYNRESSIATALHFFNKALCLKIKRFQQVEPNTGFDALRQAEADVGLEASDLNHIFADQKTIGACANQLYFLEHRRWCVYMLTRGYRCFTADQFLASAFTISGEYIDSGRKNEELRLHACLLDSGADYAPIEDLLIAYAKEYLGPNEHGKLVSKIKDIEKQNYGALQRREKIVSILKGFLSGRIAVIKQTVIASRQKKNGKCLEDWLDEVFTEGEIVPRVLPNGRISYRAMDPLDKLSLIATLCSEGDRYQDYKSYDVKIVRNLYLDVLRQRVMQYLIKEKHSKEDNSLQDCLRTLCEKWMGWDNLKATFVGDGGKELLLEYDPIAWSEEFEAILLRQGKFAVKNAIAEGERSIALQREHIFLIKVPGKGSSCIGSFKEGEKTYYVHLFRRHDEIEAPNFLSPQNKKKALWGTEPAIEARLILNEDKNLSERQLLKILKKKRR